MLRGDRLKQLRNNGRYTHEELAELLSVGVRMIARYESGETDPSADIVSRMAKVFNVSADYLLGLTDSPDTQVTEENLTQGERAAIAAWRRGDVVDAIRTIVGGDKGKEARSSA